MNEIVISKFAPVFWAKAVIFTLFVFTSTFICVAVAITDSHIYNWGQLLAITVFSAFVLYFYYKFMLASLMTITVGSEGIGINYWLSGKDINILYADITHVSNDRITGGQDTAFQSSYLLLRIDLTTGEELVFSENLFSNYHELKDSISDHRFQRES